MFCIEKLKVFTKYLRISKKCTNFARFFVKKAYHSILFINPDMQFV